MICSHCTKGLHNRCRGCGCQHSPKPLKEIVELVTAAPETMAIETEEETIDNTPE